MTGPSTSSSPALSPWLSSVLAGKSDAEILELLDRMLTRLALCGDSKLEDLLSKLLPLSISSLASESQSVRSKVLEILSHVNKRVKHQTEIGLPLVELSELYLESVSTSMVRNFCVVYIEMAMDRASKEDKESLVPAFLSVISKLPSQHQEILLRISTKVFGEYYATQIDDIVAQKYKGIGASKDRDIFLDFCLHTLLFQLSRSGGCPPGLSITLRDRVSGNKTLTSDILRDRKLAILKVLEAMELPAEEVYPLYLVACSDSQESVARRGDELLKKKGSGVDLEDAKLINKLFRLFNGNTGADQVPQESKIIPGSLALRVRLMSIFCRSIVAANSFPSTLQCIFGCIYGTDTSSRLKQFGMEFTVWVFKHAKVDQLKLMGPIILNGIISSLDSSSISDSDATVRDTKTFAYQAIGLLAGRMPQLFRDKIDMAARLFDALKAEPQFMHSVIQDSTNALSLAYKDASSSVLKMLEPLLLENSQMEQSEVRFCAVRWATSLFDLQHCPSRYICMIAAADPKLDIREMALEGLFPGEDPRRTLSSELNLKYPKLEEMLDFILTEHPALARYDGVGDSKPLFLSATYVAVIKFLLKCFEIDVKQYKIEDSKFLQSVDKLCLLLENAMSHEGSVELHANASKGLITVSSHVPQVVASMYASKVSWLKKLLGHLDFGTRESMAQLLGSASSALPVSSSSVLISELIGSISGSLKSRFEMQHGVICALGYVTANCLLRTPTISESMLQAVIKCLVGVVNCETAILASAAMQALGHMGLCIPLPPLASDGGSVDVLSLMHETLKKLIFGDDIKAVQRTIIALGHMYVKESNSSILIVVIDLIFSLCHSKAEDILFAVGEAIAFIWGSVPVTTEMILRTNYSSLSAASNFLMVDVSSASSSKRIDSEAIEDYHGVVRYAITRKLFDGLLYSNRKDERCAGTVWLLSLTMYCGHHPLIQKLLPEIQDAFSHLLGEQNELTQELASQGLSIVYELGDASMKNNLVNALVGTLTGSGKRKRVVKLVEDSEGFQDGAIGEGPSGGKLGTYKELCNLANEMGQPDLIYKFLDLANYQASLNSKRAAAFGFSKIAKYAGDALQPYLCTLIPRLVRYQYDPDKNVQDAMVHIWKSLVADSKKTIDEYLDLIIDDLLTQCGSRLWRSREASCLAIADIIQGRTFDQVEKHLGKLWKAAFRAMDDIKETVRHASDKLCRAVSSLAVRLCDISLTPMNGARQSMTIVLPVLLTEGIMSKVDTVRKASIGVVTKLAKGSGVAILPHLPDLVYCMLESLSSLEEQGLNYVELHAANVGIQAEKLDNLRISIAKSSPMWETLDFCIEVADSQSLEMLVPRLAQLVRSGVGLNTRVGVASFICRLVQKVGIDIKLFTSMLLKLLFPVVKEEKSIASKRAFANACAAVLKFAVPSQAQKSIEDTAALHAGDRNDQISGAILLRSFSSLANDTLAGYRIIVIPVIFVSRFEDDKTVSNLYEELWEENMGSERITLQLYLGEIVHLINEGIAGSSWAQKKKASQAISKLSEVLGESLSVHHHVLLRSLIKEVPGRLWEGKEVVLNALSALCTSCHKAIAATDPSAVDSILSLVLAACAKKDKKYRGAAFSCLEQIVVAFKNPDFFNLVLPSLLDMCNINAHLKWDPSTIASDRKTEDELDNFSTSHGKIISCMTSIVHVARVSDIVEQKIQLVNAVSFSLAPAIAWNVKMSVFSLLKEISTKLSDSLSNSQDPGLHASITAFLQELLQKAKPSVLECIHSIKIAQVHVAATECVLGMLNLWKDTQSLRPELGFKDELLHLLDIEKNEETKSLLRKCINILESFEQ